MTEYHPAGQIVLVAHNPAWASGFTQEAARLRDALGLNVIAIHHIGSTAIPGIAAKPVIDMLAVVHRIEDLDELPCPLTPLGYEGLGEFGIPGRRYFRRNSTEGARTHQLHTFGQGSSEIQRHLDFRDYLRAHPATAQEYDALKRGLAARHPTEIRDYTDAKTDFVRDVEHHAVEWRAGHDITRA